MTTRRKKYKKGGGDKDKITNDYVIEMNKILHYFQVNDNKIQDNFSEEELKQMWLGKYIMKGGETGNILELNKNRKTPVYPPERYTLLDFPNERKKIEDERKNFENSQNIESLLQKRPFEKEILEKIKEFKTLIIKIGEENGTYDNVKYMKCLVNINWYECHNYIKTYIYWLFNNEKIDIGNNESKMFDIIIADAEPPPPSTSSNRSKYSNNSN